MQFEFGWKRKLEIINNHARCKLDYGVGANERLKWNKRTVKNGIRCTIDGTTDQNN